MEKMRRQLLFLKKRHHLTAVKGGTEVEAMTFDEIVLMRRISQDIVPMSVKIGGPEARNDIDFMLDNGIEIVLAPMIESPYSLRNFVRTMLDSDPGQNASLAVNIETIQAFYNLNAIMATDEFRRISHITVGRSDLSGSMGKDVDDSEVTRITREIIELAREMGCSTSVGGQVTSGTAGMVQDRIPADTINTRHMVVSLRSPDISEDVRAALLWERDFYALVMKQFPARRGFCTTRIRSIEERIGQETLAESTTLH